MKMCMICEFATLLRQFPPSRMNHHIACPYPALSSYSYVNGGWQCPDDRLPVIAAPYQWKSSPQNANAIAEVELPWAHISLRAGPEHWQATVAIGPLSKKLISSSKVMRGVMAAPQTSRVQRMLCYAYQLIESRCWKGNLPSLLFPLPVGLTGVLGYWQGTTAGRASRYRLRRPLEKINKSSNKVMKEKLLKKSVFISPAELIINKFT